MKLGTSKVCITPQNPVRMCGFGFRKSEYDKVRKDIFARVFDLREGNTRVIFVYGDLLWWNKEFVDKMKKIIANVENIPQENIIFTASHNHSGPGTGKTFIPLLETADADYVKYLEYKVFKAVAEAGQNLEEVSATVAQTSCGLNVFRRVVTECGVKMAPNYSVIPDRTLTTVNFYRQDGSVKGKIVHYPCHANLSKDNELHPDYPGYALESLEKDGSTVVFWQGFTADMRPDCTKDGEFVPASEEEVALFAQRFVVAVNTATNERNLTSSLSVKEKQINLPVKQALTADEVKELKCDTEEMEQWKEKVIKKGYPDKETLKVSKVTIGDLSCLFFNAEVSMYYAAFARECKKDTLCTGYSNGMIGYLSTAEQIHQGGYEPCESATYFAVAGTFDDKIETIIKSTIEEML